MSSIPEDGISAEMRVISPEQFRGIVQANKLRKGKFKRAGILGQMTVGQISTGFILEKLGIIPKEPTLVDRANASVRDNTRPQDPSKSSTADLFDEKFYTPALLTTLIEDSSLPDKEKELLRTRVTRTHLNHK